MVLEKFITWLIAYIFQHFQPTIQFTKKFPGAKLPICRKDGSLGFDLYTPEVIRLKAGERKVVDTGIIADIPSYLGMFIWDKSSVALKKCLTVCGGVVDPGYTGSIGVILQNCSATTIQVPKYSAISQIVFHLAVRPRRMIVSRTQIPMTERGDRGFGGDKEWFKN